MKQETLKMLEFKVRSIRNGNIRPSVMRNVFFEVENTCFLLSS